MKLLDIIWKEISLVKSQRIALLLIFLYPFLAIGLLGSSFSGMDISKMGEINVGFVNNLEYDSEILDHFSALGSDGDSTVVLIEFEDRPALKEAIVRKEVIVGLVLSGNSPTKRSDVHFVYDNSNLLASRFFLEIAKAMVQQVTFSATKDRLDDIWTTLTGLGENIEAEIEQVAEFKQKLADAEKDLDALEADLDALDITEIEGMLDDQSDTINSFNTDLSDFDRDLANFKSSFEEMKAEVEAFQSDIESYRNTLETLPSEISFAVDSLDIAIENLNQINAIAPNPQLQETITLLEGRKQQMEEWRTTINAILVLFDEIEDEQSSLNISITEADAYFVQLEGASAEIKNALGNSSKDISTMNNKLSVFEESLIEVRELISGARESKIEIEQKLTASESLLSDFSEKIVEFSKIDSDLLAKPLVFYEEKVFDVDPLGILVANATAIVLILTCLLLTSIIVILEKNENVSLRLVLSPTHKVTLLTGKIIGQLGIAMVEAMIIFFVAYFAFGIDIISNFAGILLATLLIAFSFICLGLLISFFTKNQSTAILSSLLLIVPMLFLSGVILPIEFMEPFMRTASGFLPLTVSNNLLIGLVIKGQWIGELWFEIAVLAVISIVILAIVMVKKDK